MTNYLYKGFPAQLIQQYATGLALIRVSGAKKTVSLKELAVATNRVTKVSGGSAKSVATEERPKIEKVNINELTQSGLIDLPTIGSASARTILSNKPENGYQDIDELKLINNKLNRVDWGVVEERVSFA